MQKNNISKIALAAILAVFIITCTSSPKKEPAKTQAKPATTAAAIEQSVPEKKKTNTNILAGFFGKKDTAADSAEKAKKAEEKKAADAAKKAEAEKRAASLNVLDEYSVDKSSIKLQYPVLLVHAEGTRDTVFEQNLWGSIPKAITDAGVKVYFAGTDSWGTVPHNGEIIKKAIAETGERRINIIAFGKGGLEARYAISTLDSVHSDAVASLTTISTPHKGIKALDGTKKIPEALKTAFAFIVNTASRIQGDSAPDFLQSQKELTEEASQKFNAQYPNRKNVRYTSFFLKPKYEFLNTKTIFVSPFIRAADNDINDGFCPLESAKWGEYKGAIYTNLFGTGIRANAFSLVLSSLSSP